MFDLEKEIKAWKKSLHKNPSLEEGYIEELESHLLDLIENFTGKGMNEEEAFEKARNETGEVENIGAEFFKTDTKNISGIPRWQKSKWKPLLFWSNIKVALRKIRLNKGLSFSHFLGLSIGLTVAIFISIFIKSELSYNGYLQQADRTYMVYWHNQDNSTIYATTPPILRKTLRENYPQVETLAQASNDRDIKLIWKNEFLKQKSFFYAEPEIFNILNLKINSGSRSEFKNIINSVMISKSTAQKYFGKEDPLGKQLKFSRSNNKFDLTIAGVFEDVPDNSDFRPEFIANYQLFINSFPEQWRNNWGMNNPYTFIRLQPGVKANDFSKTIKYIKQKYSKDKNTLFSVIPITDVHLYTKNFRGLYITRGDISKIYIYGIIALLTLLIACINFINLHTAKTLTRAKEIGIRKVLGADRNTIIKQIITEAVLVTFISAIIALILIDLLLPLFNTIFDRKFDFTGFLNPFFFIEIIGLIILVGFFSGSYSAFLMAKLQPVQIFRERIKLNNSGSVLRKGLLGLQFVIFTGLICSSYIVYSQINFVVNSTPGYSKEQLLTVSIPAHKYSNSCNTFINEIKKHSFIKNASLASFVPPIMGNTLSNNVTKPGDEKTKLGISLIFTDENYLNTLGLSISEGRNFIRNDSASGLANILLNKEACKVLGLNDPLGKKLEMDNEQYNIIGVVNDFKLFSNYEKTPPLMFMNSRQYIDQIAIKISANNIVSAISAIRNSWNKIFPNTFLEYQFQDEAFDQIYKDDVRFSKLIYLFTGISVFIAIIGLSGLIAFSTQQRFKEIGIRKVLGANTENILYLMSKEILIITFLSFIIVTPIVFYVMKKWLENFAYKIELSPYIFLLAGLSSIIISLATIYIRVIAVANKKPSEFLKYE